MLCVCVNIVGLQGCIHLLIPKVLAAGASDRAGFVSACLNCKCRCAYVLQKEADILFAASWRCAHMHTYTHAHAGAPRVAVGVVRPLLALQRSCPPRRRQLLASRGKKAAGSLSCWRCVAWACTGDYQSLLWVWVCQRSCWPACPRRLPALRVVLLKAGQLPSVDAFLYKLHAANALSIRRTAPPVLFAAQLLQGLQVRQARTLRQLNASCLACQQIGGDLHHCMP
eukprot:1160782-Pelagomonas_calceolata.AAC.1